MAHGHVIEEGVSIDSDDTCNYVGIILNAPEVLREDPPQWQITIEDGIVSHTILTDAKGDPDPLLVMHRTPCCDGERALIKLEAILKSLVVRKRSSGKIVNALECVSGK